MVVDDCLPNPVIEQRDQLLVVRDDLIAGGSKVRALPALLIGSREFVYASPASGYAQIALAIAAKRAGVRATVFVAARKALHQRTLTAQREGAGIVQVANGYMTVVKARARDYCAVSGARLLPFGFDTPTFIEALANVARSLNISPPEIWSVAGSGVLSRALQLAWPLAAIHAVRIGAEPIAGRAILHQAPERFEDAALIPPPFQSCSTYDAKAWRFIQAEAKPGALFWNVAA